MLFRGIGLRPRCTPDRSIERTATGEPAASAHVKHSALSWPELRRRTIR